MKELKLICALIVTTLGFLSCEKDSKTDEGAAYFGGEVVNPKNNFVIL